MKSQQNRIELVTRPGSECTRRSLSAASSPTSSPQLPQLDSRHVVVDVGHEVPTSISGGGRGGDLEAVEVVVHSGSASALI